MYRKTPSEDGTEDKDVDEEMQESGLESSLELVPSGLPPPPIQSMPQ
jgi:hypothetical protein